MENLDDRAQRIQDRLRASGDEEAAELVDELYGLAWPSISPADPVKAEHVPSWERDYVKAHGRRPPMGGPPRKASGQIPQP